MRAAFRLLVSLALLASFAVQAQDQGTTGSLEIGGRATSISGSADVAAEYQTIDDGAEINLDLDSWDLGWTVSVEAEVRDEDDQDLRFDFDIDRWLRSETSWTRMPHRLGTKSLDHFTAATIHGRVTRHTDLGIGQPYEIRYERLDHRTEIQSRSTPGLTFGLEYHHQDRSGVRQQTTVSHCDSCHVISQDRRIDEKTTDVGLSALYAWLGGYVKAAFTSRELDTDPQSVFLTFDDAVHPELRAPVFDNRLQFDSAAGPQPIDLRADTSKDTIELESVLADVGGFTLNAQGIRSETTNEYTNLESEYSAFLLMANRAFGDGWTMRWRARSYSLDNDDVFVDVTEPLGIAGPQAGRSYREIYGFDPDFLRLSSLNRDVFESKLDVSKRFGKKAGTARFFWNHETIDRDHLEVAPGETDTTEDVVGISWRARPKKGWQTRLHYEHGMTDNAFALVNGAYSTLFSPSVPNPFHPNGAQYYEFHDARIADGSASPASWNEFQARASRTVGQTMFSGSYRWWDGDNGDGDLNDWSKSVQAATVTAWSAPAPKWEWYLAYSWNESELDTAASIPLFDG